MTEYPFTKTPVCMERLSLEIKASDVGPKYQAMKYKDPDLILILETLTAEEETTLDTIVADHSGQPIDADVIYVGSYTGNGTTQEIVCYARPKYIKIIRADRKYVMTKWDGELSTQGKMSMGGEKIYRWAEATEGGITFTDTGFIVGNSMTVNEDALDYLWEVKF